MLAVLALTYQLVPGRIECRGVGAVVCVVAAAPTVVAPVVALAVVVRIRSRVLVAAVPVAAAAVPAVVAVR